MNSRGWGRLDTLIELEVIEESEVGKSFIFPCHWETPTRIVLAMRKELHVLDSSLMNRSKMAWNIEVGNVSDCVRDRLRHSAYNLMYFSQLAGLTTQSWLDGCGAVDAIYSFQSQVECCVTRRSKMAMPKICKD
jgi:hypothetical protein